MHEIVRSVGVFVAGAFALLALYQNCAPQHSIKNQSESSTSEDGGLVRAMGDSENEVSHEITSPVVNAKASRAGCEIQNLKCYRKVYAPNLDDGSTEETLCLGSGGSPCLQVQTHVYNTRTAIEACTDCGPQVVLAGGEYNTRAASMFSSQCRWIRVFGRQPTSLRLCRTRRTAEQPRFHSRCPTSLATRARSEFFKKWMNSRASTTSTAST